MKRPRSYANAIRPWYRPVEHECLHRHRKLRQAMTLSKRTVITLGGVMKLIHAGYRCPYRQCAGHQRTYRSPQADALALPGFTYGLDIVLLVGRLHLQQCSERLSLVVGSTARKIIQHQWKSSLWAHSFLTLLSKQ